MRGRGRPSAVKPGVNEVSPPAVEMNGWEGGVVPPPCVEANANKRPSISRFVQGRCGGNVVDNEGVPSVSH